MKERDSQEIVLLHFTEESEVTESFYYSCYTILSHAVVAFLLLALLGYFQRLVAVV